MRTLAPLLLLLAACSGPRASPSPPAASALDRSTAALAALVAAPDPALAAVAWLAGTWATRDLGGLTIETWSPPRAGLMLGQGQSIQGGKTKFFEHLRVEIAGGQLQLVASPNGGPTTTFAQAALGPGEVVFANPGHDFPQNIRYQRQGDELRVRLEGGDKVIEFTMRRVGDGGRLKP